MASTENLSGNIALPKLYVSTDGGSVYNAIAELVESAVPESTTDQYETTHTDITDNYKTYISGWSDSGEASYTVNYREDTYSQLKALRNVDAKWRLEWSDPGNVTTDPKEEFDGAITTGPTLDTALEDRWTIAFTIKASGDSVFTAGT